MLFSASHPPSGSAISPKPCIQSAATAHICFPVSHIFLQWILSLSWYSLSLVKESVTSQLLTFCRSLSDLAKIFLNIMGSEQSWLGTIAPKVICSMWPYKYIMGFPGGSDSKESACSAEDPGSIPGSGRPPGEANGYPHQYSCLENPMDRGAWQATVHGVTKSQTQLRVSLYIYI